MNTAEEEYTADLLSQIEDISTKQSSFKGMIYGNSGAGKTVAAMQLAQKITPDDKTILFIDSYEGWVSLNNHPKLKRRTLRMRLKNIGQLEQIAKAIKQGAEVLGSVGTVIIDEHSSFADLDLLALTAKRATNDKTKDPDTPAWPDMNASSNRLHKATGQLLKVDGLNVILVSHERQDKDNRAIVVTSPAYLPKYGAKLRGVLHFVGHMDADENTDDEDGKVTYERWIQVHPTTRIIAKTRVGGFDTAQVSIRDFVKGVVAWLDRKVETVPEREAEQEVSSAVTEQSVTDSANDLLAELEEVEN